MKKYIENIEIIIVCLKSMEFCQKASQTMTPIPTQSVTMQETYESLSKIFSSFGKDFELIANLAGVSLDITTYKTKVILEKIDTFLPELNKTQRKKCLNEINTLLTVLKKNNCKHITVVEDKLEITRINQKGLMAYKISCNNTECKYMASSKKDLKRHKQEDHAYE